MELTHLRLHQPQTVVSEVSSYRGLNLGYAPLSLQSQSHAVDFYIFGLLMKHLAGKQFATEPDMNLIVTDT
jgi:hypothetical protein